MASTSSSANQDSFKNLRASKGIHTSRDLRTSVAKKTGLRASKLLADDISNDDLRASSVSVFTDVTDTDSDYSFGSDDERMGGEDVSVHGEEVRQLAHQLAEKLKDPKAVGVTLNAIGIATLRIRVRSNFIQKELAPVWGINPAKDIIAEFEMGAEPFAEVPEVSIYQSSSADLSARALSDLEPFGLQYQIIARTLEYLRAHWPPKDVGLFVDLCSFLVDAIKNCNKFCVICNEKLDFPMLKPSTCGKKSCVYSHMQYGLGEDIYREVHNSPAVVDLLINFTYAAVHGDVRRFQPAPTSVERRLPDGSRLNCGTPGNVDVAAITAALDAIPPVSKLDALGSTEAIQTTLDSYNPLSFPLLRWILTSNRTHLRYLSPSEHVKEMNTPHQFVFLCTTPEHESHFQDGKKQHGSVLAFHGSSFGNWHAIVRGGLRNLSNTELMSTGAAYGVGIYLAVESGTSFGYAPSTGGWKNSMMLDPNGNNTFQCLSICEIVKDPKYQPNPYYVIPTEDHVTTRLLFVYSPPQSLSVVAASLTNIPDPFSKASASSSSK